MLLISTDYSHSSENGPHSVGIGLRISRTPPFHDTGTRKVSHTSFVVSKADLLCSRPQTATSFCSFFSESFIVRTYQVRPICHSPTKGLYPRYQRTRSWRPSRDCPSRRHNWRAMA